MKTLCRVLKVSRSGFYKWKNRRESQREIRRQELLEKIHEIFDGSRKTYGSPRVHQKLLKCGIKVNKKTVERLMSKNNIAPKRKRRYKSTTDSRHKMPVSANVLDRKFEVSKSNEAWVGDITYVETQEGWLYLAVFLDLFSRMVIGWAMADRIDAELVVSAYEMGRSRRGSEGPAIIHSDRGSQYASELFRTAISKDDCEQSMSRKGNCWDNAVAESFFGTIKSELIYHHNFKTRKDAQLSIYEFIEIFYNKQRLHSSLNYLTPEEFELKGKKAA